MYKKLQQEKNRRVTTQFVDSRLERQVGEYYRRPYLVSGAFDTPKVY